MGLLNVIDDAVCIQPAVLLLFLMMALAYTSSCHRLRITSETGLPGNIENVDRGSDCCC